MAKSQTPKILTKKHIARLQREKQQIRVISYVALGVVAFVVMLLIYGILNQTVFKAQQPVAKVGDEKITTRSFQAYVRLTRQQMINQYSQYYQLAQMFGVDPTTDSSISSTLQQIQSQLDNSASLGENVLNQMVEAVIIRQEASRREISISPEEVDSLIQNAFGFFPAGTPTPTITPTSIIYPTLDATVLSLVTETLTPTTAPTETLLPSSTPDKKATNTPIPSITPTATQFTLDSFQEQYLQALDKYKVLGFTEDEVRKLFEDTLLRDKIYSVVTADVPHNTEKVWARHILVDSEASARKVRYELQKHGNWISEAKNYSTDTGSGAKGGDLGWFSREMMVKEFEDSAFSLKIGELSEPIKSQFGYHIIQVLGHEDRPLTADEYKQKTDEYFTNWLSTLKEQSNVITFDYYLDRIPTEPTLQDTQGQ